MKFGENLDHFLNEMMRNVPKNDEKAAMEAMTDVLAVALINDLRENNYHPMEGVLLLTGIWKEMVFADIDPDELMRGLDTLGGVQ
jgi:hypothetical protein